ncbi:acyl-CoA dehydrogenase [Maritimibacter alkaliphilus HTCC2654]|uniref:Acyl-CoA dehydrogenase, C-terminal:Acyl-CoA dehydrogenase, centralregion:Acyl-CoA dehydrogenase, N-terminal n=1 Tax=Maritimibacter alkaliphilus HTCC2654 TaxID=314271 RepID=A3VJW7_9RHOB|nr:acyl-CoA dehydrogenase family protein [Maritimibacter alkaliphilus]EAQ11473.1 Acyl-CoA dehydrogenase, C-terminal:Acyl-CoA dehydrogenase, centralregion:Acyl-CoA dehydrogenase, N-terminal [Rhodobacterales bacterium HTCC2654] [Maritimibacter alkaliphilus HTCC2654]TYP83266.1 acyl-CoA dehydrogenase [Maritimibacter alkaliphilus HTCC2654]
MLKRTIYDEEHEIFRKSVRAWAEKEVFPNSEKWREEGCVSREIWKRAGEEGFLCMYADEKYGGLGLEDFRYDMILIEEIGTREAGFFLGLHNRIAGPYMQHYANDEQRDRYMPGIVSGDTILAIAMTEPGTGSDLAGIKTRAVEMDDHWVLNGSKTYISNGFLAGLVIVAAKTNPDASHEVGLFLVEDGMEGFSRGRNLKKMGLESQDTAELFFDDVKVPKANVLGDPKGGFKTMMLNLAEERLNGAVGFVARAERAFEITMEFIMDRRAFGKPIGTFQNSRFKMASMRTEIDAAQALVDHCVREHLKGELSAEMASEAKLFTSEVEGRVVDECVQLHGGAGYMEEYEISRLYRDARISRIYAGTSEIMREIIGRGLGLDDRKRN